MAKWPAAHVAEVAERLRTVPGVDAAAEIEDVGKRAGERAPAAKSEQANTTT